MKILLPLFILFGCSLNLFSQQDYKSVDAYASKYKNPVNNVKDLFQLLDSIDAKYESDLFKTRAIYIWLIKNLEYDYEKAAKVNNSNYYEEYPTKEIDKINYVLNIKKGICGDFSTIFNFMGEYLMLKVGYVNGFGRTHEDENEFGDLEAMAKNASHAWNYINIDGIDYFVDVTWGESDEDRDYQTYFLVTPDKMITTHFPEDKDWQLLNEAITIDDYLKFPFVYSSYKDDYYLLDYFPKNNITKDHKFNHARFGVKIHPYAKDKYRLILKENLDGKILASTNRLNQAKKLLIEFDLNKLEKEKVVYIFIQKNEEEARKLIEYKILKQEKYGKY